MDNGITLGNSSECGRGMHLGCMSQKSESLYVRQSLCSNSRDEFSSLYLFLFTNENQVKGVGGEFFYI